MTPDAARAARIFLHTGLLRRFVFGAFWPLLFLRFVTDLDFEPLQLVILGTIFEITILTTEIPTGVVADIYSRKWSVVISFLVMGPAMLASAFVEPFAAVAIFHVMLGFGSTFESGAETAWITGELGSPDAAEPLILRRARLQLLAAVAGVVAFGGLGAITSLTTALTTMGALYLAWGVLLAVTMPETGFSRVTGGGASAFADMLRTGARECRTIPTLRILVIAVVIGGFAKEAMDRLDVKRLVDIGLPSDVNEVAVVAVIVAIRSIIGAVTLYGVRNRALGIGAARVMATLFIVAGVGTATLGHAQWLALGALGLVLEGGALFANQPVVQTWTNTFASSRTRATVHSFVGQAEAFGEIAGGIGLGIVAQAAGVPTALTISAVLFGVAALTVTRAHHHWDSSVTQVSG